MEEAIDKKAMVETQGIIFQSVEELALHHISVDIYLNHSLSAEEWKTGELDFMSRSVTCLFGSFVVLSGENNPIVVC